MEAIIIISGGVFLTYWSVKDEFRNNDESGIHQENEEKQHNNDSFWPF